MADNELDFTKIGPTRTTPVADFDDQEVIVQFMMEDRERGYGEPDEDRAQELEREIAKRFGPDALENTAQRAVAYHMSCDEIVEWPVRNWADCRAVLLGEVAPY